MKKFLLTATMLVCLSALSKAQQRGVGVNTTTPAATLDVVANITDTAMPDAVMVPRMTAAQLNAKNAAYNAAQNGALVFVTSGTGTAGTRTANVTGTGFYYYDSPTSLWVAVGAAPIAQRYEELRGNVVTTTATSYTPQPSDFFIITKSAAGTNLNFPTLTFADAGRVIYVFNDNTAAVANTVSTNVRGITTMTQLRGYAVVWSGTDWYSLTK